MKFAIVNRRFLQAGQPGTMTPGGAANEHL